MEFKSFPLLRCLFLYRRTPVRFWFSAALFALVNLALAWQQSLIGEAIHAVENGQAAHIGADGIDLGPAWAWLFAIVGVALARALLLYFVGWVSLVIQQDLLGHLRERILIQVQRLDLAYHWRHGAGEIVTRTTRDSDKLRDALISFWRQVVDTSFVVIAAMGFLFWYNPWLGVVPLVLTCLGFTILIRQTDRLVELDRAVGAAFDAVNQELTEGVNGIRVIKAFTLENVRVAQFQQHVHVFVEQALAALRFAASRIPIPQIVVAMGQVWVLGFGLHLIERQQLNLGQLVAAMLMLNTLVFRVEGVGRVMQIFADARSSAARIWELLDASPDIKGGDKPLPVGALALRVSDVSVTSPDGGNPVLDRLAFSVKAGEIVALVGATGSGKSTLVSLLPRLTEADAGTIAYASNHADWTDIRQLDLDDLRRKVHVVPQEGFLFSDSLAANLRLAAEHATEDDLRLALKLASAEELLMALPDGLNSKIGDRGVTLSGGQRQRVCLARALISQPSLLVLDDATSALDAVTEKNVLQNIRSLATAPFSAGVQAATTVFMVASKLSTVLLADRVLVLAGGKIVAAGTHHELVKDQSFYRELMGLDHG